MRVDDATTAIYDGLLALDSRRYRCAMWIVCGGLRSVYEDRLSAAEDALMASTLDLVRNVVIHGEVAASTARGATDLSGRWTAMTLKEEAHVMPGQWNTWAVFRDLASEIARTVPEYEAAGRVDLAATDRWREDLPGPLWEDPDEEIDELSPMARSLAFFMQVVAGVAELPDTRIRSVGWDPLQVREMIFDGSPPSPGRA